MNEYLVKYEDDKGNIKEIVIYANDTIEATAKLQEININYEYIAAIKQ